MENTKLNYKRTIYIGLAFLTITMFWQTYDSVIAKILIDKYGLSQAASGVVMALDNMLAIFLLPLFGLLSDKTKTRLGKRTPYILVGTLMAAFAFMSLSFVDNRQQMIVDQAGITEDYQYVYENVITKKGVTKGDWDEVFITITDESLNEKYRELFKGKDSSYELTAFENQDVSDIYYNSLSLRALKETKNNPANLIIFLVILLIVLISMSVYRTPAVALMPDVTPHKQRSKANAVINLMGSAGAVVSIGIFTVFGLSKESYVNYTPAFIATGVLMIVSLLVFLFKVNENKLVEEYEIVTKEEVFEEDLVPSEKLSREKMISLLLILFSVFFWFMGYNAVISKLSDYAPKILDMNFATPLLVAQAAAIVAFIPIGIISSYLGRKKMILAGVLLLTVSFASAYFLTTDTSWLLYIVLAMTGIAWATINVNSFPMAVELAKGDDVGKYTGYYYTFSMAAQIITPILSGILMDNMTMGRKVLFPYAAILVSISFFTMLFVKHGDVKVERKSILESFDVED